MLLINSIKIMFSNLGTMWKILLYKLVMLLIFFGLFAAAVLPQISNLLADISGTHLFENFANILNNILRINPEALGPEFVSFSQNLAQAGEVLANYGAAIAWVYITVFLIYCVYRFLSSLIDIPLTSVLETNLVSCAKMPLIPTLFKNLKKSAKYSLWSLLITFSSSVLVIVSIFFLTQTIFSWFAMFAMFLTMLLMVILFAFRSTVFSMWRPVAISGNHSILQSLKIGSKISFKKFWLLYTYYIIIYLGLIFVNIIIAVFTCGAGLIISIPLSLLLTSVFQLVFYFSYNRKKYYLDGDTIVKARLDHSMPDLEASENNENMETKE